MPAPTRRRSTGPTSRASGTSTRTSPGSPGSTRRSGSTSPASGCSTPSSGSSSPSRRVGGGPAVPDRPPQPAGPPTPTAEPPPAPAAASPRDTSWYWDGAAAPPPRPSWDYDPAFDDPLTFDYGAWTDPLRAFFASIRSLASAERSRVTYSLGDELPLFVDAFEDLVSERMWARSQALQDAIERVWRERLDEAPPLLFPRGRVFGNGIVVANAYAQWLLLGDAISQKLRDPAAIRALADQGHRALACLGRPCPLRRSPAGGGRLPRRGPDPAAPLGHPPVEGVAAGHGRLPVRPAR